PYWRLCGPRLRAWADNRRRRPGAFRCLRTWLAGRPGPVHCRPVWPRRPAIGPVRFGPVLTGLVLFGSGSGFADRAGVRWSAPARRRRSAEQAAPANRHWRSRRRPGTPGAGSRWWSSARNPVEPPTAVPNRHHVEVPTPGHHCDPGQRTLPIPGQLTTDLLGTARTSPRRAIGWYQNRLWG